METPMASKHIVNGLDEATHENQVGFVACNGHLMLVEGLDLIVRKDFREEVIGRDHVAIISGGGSGHEPLQAGYVGPGLLTGAVAGQIFSSPSTGIILDAIRLLGPKNTGTAGVLLIILNYTGDRLNFGLACERARTEGINVDMLVFGDDSASHGSRAGRRGLAGVVFVNKIAGALAEEGHSLSYIKAEVDKVAQKIATISVSVSAANIPGIGASFTLSPEEMEVGLGIHGESGVSRVQKCSAKEVVQMMLSHLREDERLKEHFNASGSEPARVALLINNLGGLSNFEMNIVANEAVAQLRAKHFVIERVFCGTFVTSFGMSGVSLSLLALDPETQDRTLALLDAPCYSAALRCQTGIIRRPNSELGALMKRQATDKAQLDYLAIDGLPFDSKFFLEPLEEACHRLIEAEQYLNELDTESGDGDTGATYSKGAKSILSALRNKTLVPSFLQLAHISEQVVGGSSGALYGLLFTGISAFVAKGKADGALEADNLIGFWGKALEEGIRAVSRYSLARVGDRTMLDSLVAVQRTLEGNKLLDDRVALALMVTKAVEEAAQATASMAPKVGRASYVHIGRVTGPDPGAMGVSIWMRAIVKCLSQ